MFTWIRNLFNRHGSHPNPSAEPTTKEPQSTSNSSSSAEKPNEKCSHQSVDSAPKSDPTKTTETREETVNIARVDEHSAVQPLLKMTPIVQEVSRKTEVTPITSGPEITMEYAKVGLISLSDGKLTDEIEVIASARQATVSNDLAPTYDLDSGATKVESMNLKMANDEHVLVTSDKTEDVKEEEKGKESEREEQIVVEEKMEQIQHKFEGGDRSEENEEVHKQEEAPKAERTEDEKVEDKDTSENEVKEQEESEKEQVEQEIERVEHEEDHIEENEEGNKASENEKSPETEEQLGHEKVEKHEYDEIHAVPMLTNEETENMQVHTEEVPVSENKPISFEKDSLMGEVSVPVQEISSTPPITSEIVGVNDQI